MTESICRKGICKAETIERTQIKINVGYLALAPDHITWWSLKHPCSLDWSGAKIHRKRGRRPAHEWCRITPDHSDGRRWRGWGISLFLLDWSIGCCISIWWIECRNLIYRWGGELDMIEGLGGNTYVIPRHCLLPLENETMYFSSALPSSPSQRSGMNSYEFGKMVSLWCIRTDVMPTGVYINQISLCLPGWWIGTYTGRYRPFLESKFFIWCNSLEPGGKTIC